MPLPLLGGSITYSKADQEERNILLQLDHPSQHSKYLLRVRQQRRVIEKLVAHHLGLRASQCRITGSAAWISGSFNLCVPVAVTIKSHTRHVLMRFPLPYRVRDGDEKVRCEAGTYSWLQQECPTIPIPRLYGFGLSTGQYYTSLENFAFPMRLFYRVQRWCLSFFTPSRWSNLVRHPNTTVAALNLGAYLLIDCITDTEMLSNTWDQRCFDANLRANLFRDLSKILISMTRIPQPRIGSFVVDDSGRLRLANRPLTMMLVELENQAIPVPIKKDQTFSSSQSYVNALLACHNSRLEHQPNAVTGSGDCVDQMATTTLMQTVAPHHLDSSYDHGPFAFLLTDSHVSNIMVDDNWNVKWLLDLEFAAVLPTEWMSQFPVLDEDEDAFRQEFRTALECEAKTTPVTSDGRQNRGTSSDIFWYVLALTSPLQTFNIFKDKIRPLFVRSYAGKDTFAVDLARFWKRDALEFVQAKVQQRKTFDAQLRKRFDLED